MSFVPTIDENDGRLIYVAEPYIRLQYFYKVIIAMPFEFSIALEDEEDINKHDTSKIVKLTFWDLLETFDTLNIASSFIVYHDSELDEIGKQLQGFANQFWGASADNILDTIFISRQIYSWLKTRLDTGKGMKNMFQEDMYKECLNFHKRNGIVGIDENDEVEKVFFERALLQRRRKHQKRKRIQASIAQVADLFEEEAYKKAARFWELIKDEGRIIYYPPGELPII